ncbi:glycine cleavage system aminomethyltransferase GcvT [Fodinicurvata sp. EGI_FJ10296]|uniref:glycine cleavage system aminomethyltransferase GcvT n=1 Tax=Fodinicurvata sp. EGI_FJ10296 TaxID=3231908 RepID=UPI0034571096
MTDPTTTDNTDALKATPLNALHRAHGARMVPFAGYEMPVQFPAGIMKEHAQTRNAAGLFDVSHMGQAILRGPDPEAAIETLVPGNIAGLKTDRMRYTQLTNVKGGILDDLMVTRRADHLFLVVNAACKDDDIAHIRSGLPAGHEVEVLDRGLLALQGPQAAAVLSRLIGSAEGDAVAQMPFMSCRDSAFDGVEVLISRCGYTGEDGYELSVPSDKAAGIAERLLDQPEVEPIGLGARDSLRLEAGLCLYGHDIDTTTTPIEADLAWSIGKRRREEGGFPGASVIQQQLRDGAPRRRVGIRPEGRAPAREGAVIVDENGAEIGRVTSGGFGPTVQAPVAMGYVAAGHDAPGTRIGLVVRGKTVPATIAALPFVPQNYFRSAAGSKT